MRPRFGGWPLVGWAALAVGAACIAQLLFLGVGSDGLRATIRLTARTSLALFLLAFVARPWQRVRPGAAGRWLLANRRYLGVSFAASHAVHGLFILLLWWRYPSALHVDAVTTAGGLLGYLFLAAMTATSFDGAAAWLGRRRWRLLHGLGMYYLWGVFAFSYGARAFVSPRYSLLALPLAAAMALRLFAAVR